METFVDNQKAFFCQHCGQRIDPDNHDCEPPEQVINIADQPTHIQNLLNVIMDAEAALEGTHYDPVLVLGRIKRALWTYQPTKEQRLFASLRTTAELPTTTWD